MYLWEGVFWPIILFDTSLMEWFCGCLPTVNELTAIQAFKPIQGNTIIGPADSINIGHNTVANSTKTMVFSDTDRIKPI